MIRIGQISYCSLVALVILATIPGAAVAQAESRDGATSDDTVHAAAREASHTGPSDLDRIGERERREIRERILDRIQADPALGPEERARMEGNLDVCLRLGLAQHQIDALFPWHDDRGQVNGGHLLRMQQRVLDAAEAGAPPDLIADKIAEGRRKGVDPERLDRAATRMAEHVQTAHSEMMRMAGEGISRTGDARTERHLEKGLALDMWRGLGKDDLNRLGEHAMERARSRDCSTVDLAAAAETATELIESGVERHRSREMAGVALAQGYSARELREMGAVVRASRHDGAHPPEAMLEWMERGLYAGQPMNEMMQEMMEHGWMGPRDIYGAGCHSPVDDVLGGPGYGGDHHSGGDGRDGHDGGGHDGGGHDGWNGQDGGGHEGGSHGDSSGRNRGTGSSADSSHR